MDAIKMSLAQELKTLGFDLSTFLHVRYSEESPRGTANEWYTEVVPMNIDLPSPAMVVTIDFHLRQPPTERSNLTAVVLGYKTDQYYRHLKSYFPQLMRPPDRQAILDYARTRIRALTIKEMFPILPAESRQARRQARR